MPRPSGHMAEWPTRGLIVHPAMTPSGQGIICILSHLCDLARCENSIFQSHSFFYLTRSVVSYDLCGI